MLFDPDDAAPPGSGIFGLPHGPEEASVHVLGVPFHATTSYRRGTAAGPAAVRAASGQVELADRVFGEPWRAGIWMAPEDRELVEWNAEATRLADPILAAGGAPADDAGLARVNAIGAALNEGVRAWTDEALGAGRLPVVLGGDHSVPFGAIEAAAARHPGLGILHVDAHADLRCAYEGFTWSHASILFNVTDRLDVARVVQFGIRDLGRAELARIEESDGRILTVFDEEWARLRRAGGLEERARSAIAALPEEVWITFDVDGLDPALCPNTGTPVPGGLDWHDATLVLEELARSGKRVVGLDLCEVAPGDGEAGAGWDAIVGARLLYRLIGCALTTRGD